jgi:hypothetical protein
MRDHHGIGCGSVLSGVFVSPLGPIRYYIMNIIPGGRHA